ncbi:PTS lactose/cellobiose transporter subunit IIA [Serratia entomophila]|jgi:PTS system cellobiose-specific IIA component|uniref:PTS lactose/cellobiose transporter subunit IIA n=2 Tax=Serratia entomophila TaxID=42906 RepID=A0ABY5CX00_9GAMM|nr:PTS lactose/cellobiose transporter subunit IIA [Serratia entomophila]USV02636.1 PTS lactose/cellobiose transporter subunit IIA [Serratia entomophila]CAI0713726.1 N,N'-diacetylchitobiose-specific phosphotransferase enzyme IIA component [Serratia entomophila]CAI0841369.1 N,N'-diacetylchitobiose-specific phosphotransferase enzyme IIA component [Serratia entomophila]CAI0846926.1 N,N'-diacetylchitobiose-specific phosphotransferase enzyme IIA component [Serratia entomophila]CAI0852160.1 N,N'-diac
MDLETSVMELLVQAGSARSALLSALQQARRGEFDAAAALLAEANAAIGRAHGMQTELIGMDEGVGKIPVSLILVHAQDHLMNAMLIQDLATDMIELYRRLARGADND